MRPRIERPNWFAIHGRAVKADALVAEIHKLRGRLGISESAMLESVVHWTPLWWASLAVQCGKEPPSETTKDVVVAALAASALVERLATDEPYFSSDRDSRPTPFQRRLPSGQWSAP